jgi:protein tyrosine phosphatase
VKGFYVNASLMRSVLGNKVYAIFAQAPVKKVVDHFWVACYQYKIKKIVMLCSF